MMSLPAPSILLASILFGAIGVAAFVYGKKQHNMRALILGIALCAFPYLTGDRALLTWLIGAVLTAALFLWRE